VSSKTQDAFDVLVVGSGASGGWAAKRLAEAGVKVALVDAGRPQNIASFTEHEQGFTLPYRDQAAELIKRTRPTQKDCYACMEWNYDWFCNDLEKPYATADDKPFSWQGRMRVTGGRTNVWGRQSYRLSDLDFKAASHDGYGEDWPLSYVDLARYYDIVEEYVGISGQAEGVYELPDGKFQPPMAMTCSEVALRKRVKSALGRTITIGRTANLTKGINGRAACHYCGPCERGCVTRSYFNSAFTTVPDAIATGRCTHVPNAMVYKVLVDPDKGRAKGLLYVDRVTREPKEVRGRVIVLCAQALESVRILFNSATRQHPQGLANSSGVLGHYLMDHLTGGGAWGDFEEAGDLCRGLGARLRHPRGRRRAHGQRREEVGAQRLPADARREEPVRDGRLGLPLERLPEPDAHDHGPHRPLDRPPARRAEARQPLACEPVRNATGAAAFQRAGSRSLPCPSRRARCGARRPAASSRRRRCRPLWCSGFRPPARRRSCR
jgi:choline dehydrogenase-like flavoprotein